MSIQKSEWNTPQVKKNYTLKIQIRNILGEYPKIYKNNHFKMQKKSSAQMSRIYPWNNMSQSYAARNAWQSSTNYRPKTENYE